MTALVHVRWARPAAADTPDAWLDATERLRLKGLDRPEDRARFVTSRALLKTLVGSLTGGSAADVSLRYDCDQCGGLHGRPRLAGAAGADGWEVSLSHAGNRVLVAATRAAPIGVDVEAVVAVGFSGFRDVALSDSEQELVSALAPSERGPAMARIWVRKEARLKATGTGLRVDPRAVDTTSAPPGWTDVDLDVGTDYVAALSILSPGPVELDGQRVTRGAAGRGAARSRATAGRAR